MLRITCTENSVVKGKILKIIIIIYLQENQQNLFCLIKSSQIWGYIHKNEISILSQSFNLLYNFQTQNQAFHFILSLSKTYNLLANLADIQQPLYSFRQICREGTQYSDLEEQYYSLTLLFTGYVALVTSSIFSENCCHK